MAGAVCEEVPFLAVVVILAELGTLCHGTSNTDVLQSVFSTWHCSCEFTCTEYIIKIMEIASLVEMNQAIDAWWLS